MAKIVIELRDFATVAKANVLVAMIHNTLYDEEEVKEIRLEV